jgi:polyphosphate glucokinase
MPATIEKHSAPATGAGDDLNILCIDVGGTLIKTAVVNPAGALVSDFITNQTPKPATPEAILELIAGVVKSLPTFGRVSVGFPGVVGRDGVKTAPNLGTPYWVDFDLEAALAKQLGVPVRALNDAIVYGLGVIKGDGRECVLTFGTGMGFALFVNGSAFFGLELGQHKPTGDWNYDSFIGHAAYLDVGVEAWNERAKFVIDTIQALTNVDHLLIGGGNSRRITFGLPPWASVVPPSSGILGGARLWRSDMDQWFREPGASIGATAEQR